MTDALAKLWGRPLIVQWRTFFSALLEPWTVVLFILIGYLVYVSTVEINRTPVDRDIVTLLGVAVSIASGIVGAVLSKRWFDVIERDAMRARGRGAVRNLDHLIASVKLLQDRVKEYIRRVDSGNLAPEVIRTYLEEIIEKCKMIELDGLNSVESWEDLVPEADIRSKINQYLQKQRQIENLIVERDRAADALDELKSEHDRGSGETAGVPDEIASLQKSVTNKTRLIDNLTRQYRREKEKAENQGANGVDATVASLYGGHPRIPDS